MISPPVPLALDPPRHPQVWKVVVEPAGPSVAARAEPITARVRLRLVVRADGTVGTVDVVISSGRPEFDTAAVDAARGWRFLPARRDGIAIESRVLIWVTYVMEP